VRQLEIHHMEQVSRMQQGTTMMQRLQQQMRDAQKEHEKRIMEEKIREWEKVCAAMALAETEAARKNEEWATSCPVATCYWLQNAASITTEVPIRWLYHSACGATFSLCAITTCGKVEPVKDCAAHHVATQSQYCWLRYFLCTNLKAPCKKENMWYIYKADVRLKRPPPPEGSGLRGYGDGNHGGADCCDCYCDKNCQPVCVCRCDCESLMRSCLTDLELLLNREIRSLLCLFSCQSSLHPARCCGPAPCYESTQARHDRWAEEIEAARETRTAAFYEQHDATKLGFKRSISSRRLYAHHVADGVPAQSTGGEPEQGTAGAIAPVEQRMDREGETV